MWWSPSPSIPYRLLSTVPGWENPLLSQREHHQPVSALDAGVPPGRMGLGLQMDMAGSLPAAPTMRRTSHVCRGAGGHHMSPGITLSPIKKCPPHGCQCFLQLLFGVPTKKQHPQITDIGVSQPRSSPASPPSSFPPFFFPTSWKNAPCVCWAPSSRSPRDCGHPYPKSSSLLGSAICMPRVLGGGFSPPQAKRRVGSWI